jgi:2-polyprenyl-3-methyl-5-hydroxy-6-metoxy-1,4-benzoquinol methylase
MTAKRFLSTTHLHIYAIINTIIKHKYNLKGITTIKILDVGCGNGLLLSTLVRELPLKHPGVSFEFYGLDVDDSHVQERGYFSKTISLLQSVAPQIIWDNNLKLITSNDQWPFTDNFFDLIFSNQVMEHVFNQELFLKEIHRTMAGHGYSFHLYTLRHYFYEGHLLIPFVHKF